MLELPHALDIVIMQGGRKSVAFDRQRSDRGLLSHSESSTYTEMCRVCYESPLPLF
jgi:hypothetical protein